MQHCKYHGFNLISDSRRKIEKKISPTDISFKIYFRIGPYSSFFNLCAPIHLLTYKPSLLFIPTLFSITMTVDRKVHQIYIIITFFLWLSFIFCDFRISIQQQRHISDSKVNNRRTKVLRNSEVKDQRWSTIQVNWMGINLHFLLHLIWSYKTLSLEMTFMHLNLNSWFTRENRNGEKWISEGSWIILYIRDHNL